MTQRVLHVQIRQKGASLSSPRSRNFIRRRLAKLMVVRRYIPHQRTTTAKDETAVIPNGFDVTH